MPVIRKAFRPVDVQYVANDTAPCRLFKDKELQLLLFDRRVQYNGLGRIPFGSSYYCHKILPKQIIFENLQVVKGEMSRMHQDMQRLMKT